MPGTEILGHISGLRVAVMRRRGLGHRDQGLRRPVAEVERAGEFIIPHPVANRRRWKDQYNISVYAFAYNFRLFRACRARAILSKMA